MKLRQSMRIHSRIPAKFHPDQIWSDKALGFLKRLPQQQQEAKALVQDQGVKGGTRPVAILDQYGT